MNKFFILPGILLSTSLITSGCVTNTIRYSADLVHLDSVDKSYPLVYELKEQRGQLDIISTILAGQDQLIVENYQHWKLINIKNNKVLKSFKHIGIINDHLKYIPESQRLLIASLNPDNKKAETVTIKSAKTLKTIKSFNGGGTSTADVGLSPNGRVLFMDSALWSVNSGEKLLELDREYSANDHAFSQDSRYFIITTRFGPHLFDIQAKREISADLGPRDVTHPVFRADNHYYASFDFDFKASYHLGGDYPASIGLFNAQQYKPVKQYETGHRIACWTPLPNGTVFVSKANGDILLLSSELVPVKKWSFNKKARYCAARNNHSVWLGVDKSGVYKIDLEKQTFEHPIKLNNVINKFILSQDGKYLGLQSAIDQSSHTLVYQIQ